MNKKTRKEKIRKNILILSFSPVELSVYSYATTYVQTITFLKILLALKFVLIFFLKIGKAEKRRSKRTTLALMGTEGT